MLLRIVFEGMRYLAPSNEGEAWDYAYCEDGKIIFVWGGGLGKKPYSYVKAYPMTPEELNKGIRWLLEEGQVEGLAQMKAKEWN